MSQSVADYIHDGFFKGVGAFKGTRSVEIGAAVIEWPGALADWRSSDGKSYGQVAFYYMCDHWNVLRVSNELPLRAEQFSFPLRGVTKTAAKKLVVDLGRLDTKHIAYLKPARWQMGC